MVRADGYSRHLPSQEATFFALRDSWDGNPSTTILLCRDKASGVAIGTLRISRDTEVSPMPLVIDDGVLLPSWIATQSRAEITRFAVSQTAHQETRLILMKASYAYCIANRVRWMVVGARSRALIRMYKGLGFQEVFDEDYWIPFRNAGGIPHRVLALDVGSAEVMWRTCGHRLYSYMIETHHLDVQLSAARTE